MSCKSCMARSLVLSALLLGLIGGAGANSFLKAKASTREQRMSEEEVQRSLLAEVEGTFGEGSASSRLKQLEKVLRPMYVALPKNEKGYLGHATVRYALHRLFVQRHGWFINGLHERGEHRNSTTTAGILKEQVPAYVQDLFEKRLGDRGFGLHELGVLAATIEHLAHKEAIQKLGDAFKVHDQLPTAILNEQEVDTVLDTYMAGYILGEDLSKLSTEEAANLTVEITEVFGAWDATKEFVRTTRKNIIAHEGSSDQKSQGVFDFALAARVAERLGEQFGKFQVKECHDIKAKLVAMEEPGTGRVKLSDFYKPALGGEWQFSESVNYLRQLGALDEADPATPRVIIPNYINSPSQCIASSAFYSVCCMDECESLLSHLEQNLAAPEASPEKIIALVTALSSSSMAAPRQLSAQLLRRLDEIGTEHKGKVPLHGRLFAQWMHHAYPLECPFPHLSGTTKPQTPDEWLETTGEETMATEEEMAIHVDKHTPVDPMDVGTLPWLPEEELLVARPVHMRSPCSILRNLLLCLTIVTLALGTVRSSTMLPLGGKPVKTKGAEKYFV